MKYKNKRNECAPLISIFHLNSILKAQQHAPISRANDDAGESSSKGFFKTFPISYSMNIKTKTYIWMKWRQNILISFLLLALLTSSTFINMWHLRKIRFYEHSSFIFYAWRKLFLRIFLWEFKELSLNWIYGAKNAWKSTMLLCLIVI